MDVYGSGAVWPAGPEARERLRTGDERLGLGGSASFGFGAPSYQSATLGTW